MSTFLDIIFASILGGFITFITINTNYVFRQTWATYNQELLVNQMLITNAQIVESEFRNMGAGIDTSTNTVEIARDTAIQFWTSLSPLPNSTMSKIQYYLGGASETSSMDNPNIRFLYRQQDAAAAQRVGLVSHFSIAYYTGDGDSLATPMIGKTQCMDIRIVEITMEVQSPYAAFIDDKGQKQFSVALWKQTRLASQNLKR